jgi:hypothetical protein
MKREIKTLHRTIKFRQSTKDLLDKLSLIHDRTFADTIEQLIIAEAKRKGLVKKNEESTAD